MAEVPAAFLDSHFPLPPLPLFAITDPRAGFENINPAPHPGETREGEGFNPTCPGAAKLCLSVTFTAAWMPMANTGYMHQNNEGKKCLTFLIVLIKKISISIGKTWLAITSFIFRMTPSHFLTPPWPGGQNSRIFPPPHQEGNFCSNQTTGVNRGWNAPVTFLSRLG